MDFAQGRHVAHLLWTCLVPSQYHFVSFVVDVWQTWLTSFETCFEANALIKGFETNVVARGYGVDVAAKGFKVNAATRGSKANAIMGGDKLNIFTSTISTFVVRRKMVLNLKFFGIIKGGMVELGNMKCKKDEWTNT